MNINATCSPEAVQERPNVYLANRRYIAVLPLLVLAPPTGSCHSYNLDALISPFSVSLNCIKRNQSLPFTGYSLRLRGRYQSVDTVRRSNRYYYENYTKLPGHKYTVWEYLTFSTLNWCYLYLPLPVI